VHGVLGVLAEVTLSLPLNILQYFFQKIQQIPLEQLDSQLLHFISKITHAAVYSPEVIFFLLPLAFFVAHNNFVLKNTPEEPVPRYGADIYWMVMRDESPVSKEVAHQAYTSLAQFCGWTPYPEHRSVSPLFSPFFESNAAK